MERKGEREERKRERAEKIIATVLINKYVYLEYILVCNKIMKEIVISLIFGFELMILENRTQNCSQSNLS